MPSPQNSAQSAVDSVTGSSVNYVASLLSGVKWGGATGSTVALTFSFPLNNSPIAAWATNPYYLELSDETSTASALTAAQQVAARTAVASWTAVSNLALTETADSSVSVGDLRFAWTAKTAPSTAGGNAVAWTYDPSSSLARGGDVWLSQPILGSEPASSWNASGWGYVTLIHELGHALGLKHPFAGSPVLTSSQDSRQYTVMSYNAHPHSLFVRVNANPDGSYTASSTKVEPDTPMLYDIAAIQYLYGANTSYRTGNDAYSFDPSTPFIRTLWDAGGTDTISVANFTKGCVIDLQAGHFSKITIESDPISAGVRWTATPPTPTFDGTDDLAIAYGTIIENAVGGSGSDALIGNNVDNSLTGGAGSDTLTGGAGNDTIDGGTGDDTAVFSGTRDSYTITVGAGGAIAVWDARSGSLDGTDTVTSVEYFQFSDVTLQVSTVADTTPPSASRFVPAGEATNVAVNANIVINFSESVQRGTGDIVLKKADGTTVEIFSAATSGNLSFSGVTLAIDPSANLAAGIAYKVEFVAGAVKDLAGNAYAGTTSYNFTTGTYVNHSPAGSVAIAGTPVQGQTLTASNTITDSDGLGTVTYQWMANNGTAWTSLTTGGTFTLTDAQVGKQIRVLASYTDGQGSAETVGSPTTSTVARGAGSSGKLITGTAGSDSLSGGPGDTVQGGLGNDTLDGGTGNCTLEGGAGNDMYLISGPGIVVSENASEGADWVRTSLSAYTLSANVENLVYTGSSSFSGTGTSLDNMIIGGPSDDTLDGGFGNDVLSGGAGNDIFVLNSAGDVVNESANEGIDTIKSAAFSYVLGPNMENLIYTGASSFTGYGNELANAITGGPGRDLLRGGIGNDTTDGGAALDTAVYSGKRSDYTIAKNANGSHTVADKRATALTSDGTDNLTNVERLRFSDENVALDLDGSGGTVAKILGTVFGATTATEKQYVGYGLMLLDGGMSNDDLMKLALDARLGKGFTNESAIRLIYQNLLGSAPSQSEIGYYSALIATQQYTQAALALVAADSSLNTGNIHLTGLAATGLEYLPTA